MANLINSAFSYRGVTSELTRRRESKHRRPTRLVEKHAPAARVQRFVGRQCADSSPRTALPPPLRIKRRDHKTPRINGDVSNDHRKEVAPPNEKCSGRYPADKKGQ